MFTISAPNANNLVYMSKDNEQDSDEDVRTGVITKAKPKTKKPSLYKVPVTERRLHPDGVCCAYSGAVF